MSKTFEELVDEKYRDLKAGSVPRSLAQDAKELALIAAREERAAVDALVRRKLQEYHDAHGTGEHIVPSGSAPTTEERLAYFTTDVKDAPELEHRNAFGVPED